MRLVETPHLSASIEPLVLFLHNHEHSFCWNSLSPERSYLSLSLLCPVFSMFGADSSKITSHFKKKKLKCDYIICSPFLSLIPPMYPHPALF